jgi:hypothetical protein
LLADDRLQDIARLGNMRKIDLGLDFVSISPAGPRGSARGLGFAGGAEVCAHLHRLVLFKGTGMSLLLRDPNLWKYVENRFAFDFQLPCQIVDSNLAHPPFLSPRLSA